MVVTFLYLAKNRDYIDNPSFNNYYQKTEKLIISIQALRKSINRETK